MPERVGILFTDLVEFSAWALEVGDEKSFELLRSVDAVVTVCVQARGGEIVKRLGDGMMAVFDDPAEAVAAAEEAIRATGALQVGGVSPGHERRRASRPPPRHWA